MRYPELLENLEKIFGLAGRLPEDEDQVSLDIEGCGRLVAVPAGDSGAILMVLASRTRRDEPTRKALLQATAHSKGLMVPLRPIESPDGSSYGFGIRLDSQTDRGGLDGIIRALINTLQSTQS